MASKTPPAPSFMRPGILPGLLGIVGMFVGMATYGSEFYLYTLFVVCIMAAILCVFANRSAGAVKWVFLLAFAGIAVFWNPVYPLTNGYAGQVWLLVQVAAAAVFFFGGLLIKTPADAA
jgi:hypothetical protein